MSSGIKLKLINFRCYSNYEIELPTKGTYLITGENGKGKTTIFLGLAYGLYGKISTSSKNHKPYKHSVSGSKTSVEIEWEDLKVTRNAKPKSLTVIYKKKTYTGDSAQIVIEKFMGATYNEFMISSYVVQKMESSIVTLNSQDQLSLIQTIAGVHSNLETKREKLREMIKEIRSSKEPKMAEIATIEQLIKEKGEIPEVDSDIGDENREEVSLKIRQLKKKISLLEEEFQETSTRLQKISSATTQIQKLKSEGDKLQSQLDFFKDNLADVQNRASLLDSAKLQKEKTDLTYEMAEITSNIKEFELAERRKLDREKEQAFLQKEKKRLELKILPDVSNYEKITSDLIGYKSVLKSYNEVKGEWDKEDKQHKELFLDILTKINATGILEDKITFQYPVLKVISALEECKISGVGGNVKMNCPCCSEVVYYRDGGLYTKKSKVNISVKILDEWLEKLRKIHSTLKNPPIPPVIQKRLQSVFEECDCENLKSIEKLIESREKIAKESHFAKTSLNSLVLRQEEEMPPKSKLTKKDLESKFSELEKKRDDISHSLIEISSLRKEIIEITSKINQTKKSLSDIESKLEKYSCLPNDRSEELAKECSRLSSLLTKKRDRLDIHQENLERIRKYEEYLERVSEIKNLEKSVTKKKKELIEIEEEIEGCISLEDAFKVAEIEALEKTIANINEHARIHLSRLFEIPISISIQRSTSTQRKKVSLSTHIEYKGDVYETIEEMSGGEVQRINLAFLLTCCDVLKSKIVLLDESLNNLNSELNSEAITYIKNYFSNNKVVLVVSHEAVKGLFDGEIAI